MAQTASAIRTAAPTPQPASIRWKEAPPASHMMKSQPLQTDAREAEGSLGRAASGSSPNGLVMSWSTF